jgi:hypothetical protein
VRTPTLQIPCTATQGKKRRKAGGIPAEVLVDSARVRVVKGSLPNIAFMRAACPAIILLYRRHRVRGRPGPRGTLGSSSLTFRSSLTPCLLRPGQILAGHLAGLMGVDGDSFRMDGDTEDSKRFLQAHAEHISRL